MKGYFKLYCWLRHCFRENKFTTKQFKEEYSTPQYTKVLYDLTKLGYIERSKRGEYRIKSPREIEDEIIKKDLENTHLLDKVKDKKYAFTHANAIRIWSNGKHHPGITDGLKPIHIQILEKDLGWWKKILKKHDASYHMTGKNRTLFGVVYILHPAEKIRAVKKHGMPVIPLDTALSQLDPNHPETKKIRRELGKNRM